MAVTITAPHARATARHQHVSPYKVRQVLDLVRGLSIEDAERTLQLCEKGAAEDVAKVLQSAIANAEHNFHLTADELYVAVAFADEGPTRKWGQPRARGRYFRIRRRTSHITLIVARYDEDDLERRRRQEESSGRGSAVAQRRRAERVRRSRRQQAQPPDHDHDHDHEEAPALDDDTTLAGEAAEAADGEYVDVEQAIAEEAEAEEGAEVGADEQGEPTAEPTEPGATRERESE
jgi:large subunit ribosomal protein L22